MSFDINVGEGFIFCSSLFRQPDIFCAIGITSLEDTGQNYRAEIAKATGTPRPENTQKTMMDDETLVGSASPPKTSPRSASTITSPRTTFTGGAGTFRTGRQRPLYSLADVVTELKRSSEHHAGSSLFIATGYYDRDCTDDIISDG